MFIEWDNYSVRCLNKESRVDPRTLVYDPIIGAGIDLYRETPDNMFQRDYSVSNTDSTILWCFTVQECRGSCECKD